MRWIIGVDLEESGELALKEGLRLCARGDESELHLVHVLSSGAAVASTDIAAIDTALSEAEAALRQALSHAAEQLGLPEAWEREVVFHLRISDDAASALAQVAVDVEADAIVCGTRERNCAARILLGSVAETLLATSPVPVVVARPYDLTAREKTPRPEPATPGVDLHAKRMTWSHDRISFAPKRNSHIAGLV